MFEYDLCSAIRRSSYKLHGNMLLLSKQASQTKDTGLYVLEQWTQGSPGLKTNALRSSGAARSGGNRSQGPSLSQRLVTVNVLTRGVDALSSPNSCTKPVTLYLGIPPVPTSKDSGVVKDTFPKRPPALQTRCGSPADTGRASGWWNSDIRKPGAEARPQLKSPVRI